MTDTQTTTPAFDALKPCPFCGGNIECTEHDEPQHYYTCQQCKIRINFSSDLWGDEAHQFINTRADQCIPASDIRPLVEALDLIANGKKIDYDTWEVIDQEDMEQVAKQALAQFQQLHPEVMK
jgi:hypothetical protein